MAFPTASIQSEINRFQPQLPLEQASPPPASWYLQPDFAQLEQETVFSNHWLFVGYLEQVAQPGDYFCGNFNGKPYVVSRDQQGQLHALYNVCSHHGTRVASGCGKASLFTCPYHGWQYGLDGQLRKAPQAGAIAQLRQRAPGLKPIPHASWGPFILLHFGQPTPFAETAAELNLELPGLRWQGLQHVARRSYPMACNWKVFVDNYLDGGYHVAHMHPKLAEALDLKNYRSRLGDLFATQTCPARNSDPRLGQDTVYLWVHPNFMINRYGSWMDTNLVIPLGPDRCEVVFDYFHEGPVSPEHLTEALADSDRVQQEDMAIVGMVMEGLGSGAYAGLYAPRFEAPMYLFHQLLHRDFSVSTRARHPLEETP